MERPFRFAPPPPGPRVFARPRLLELLDRRWTHRLVAVEAGPGLGKTTLLAQAMAKPRLRGSGRDAWLTCEPSDASASDFVRGLLGALGIRRPETAPSTVEEVCEAAWALAPEHVCLVIDDVHRLEPSSPGLDVLGALLEELPGNAHVVVGGRSLAGLARTRLVAQGRATEIGEADLLLDAVEIEHLAGLHGLDPGVLRDTAGWPALAELWAATGVANAERFVWEEVLSELDESTRLDFVAVVACGGGSAEVTEAAAGHPIDVNALARLPLVTSTPDSAVHPHPLWEDLLRDQMASEVAHGARRRVAGMLRATGAPGLAFEQLAAVGDWDAAIEALFDACNDPAHPPWPDALERWSTLVPGEFRDRPEVAYLRAMIERSRDAWSHACRHAFSEAITGFRSSGDIGREFAAAVRASFLDWIKAEEHGLAELAERARGVAPGDPGLVPIFALNRAVVADIRGDAHAAISSARSIDVTEPRLAHLGPLVETFAHLARGDGGAAAARAGEARALAESVTPAAGTGWALIAPAVAAWMCGDVRAAQRGSTGDPGPRFGLAERVPAITVACLLAAHLGDVAVARELDAELRALVPETGERDLLAGFFAVARAAIAVAAGDESRAVAALAEELGDRPLAPAGAGRALRWFPGLPWLFHPGARAFLSDGRGAGNERDHLLEVCDALLAARSGGPFDVEVLEDAERLLTAFPVPLAVELVVRGVSVDERRAALAIRTLASIAPGPVREGLGRLADSPDASIKRAVNALRAAVPIAPPHAVRIEAFGPCRLLRGGVAVDDPDWRRERVRQLLLNLVAHREARRDRLGVDLWPDADESSMSSNLRLTLSYLQALLEPHRSRGDAPWFLRQDAGILRLAGEGHLSVDIWEFEDHVRAAADAATAGNPAAELAHLVAAVALWHGDPFEDVATEEWAQPVRERLRVLAVRAAERAAALLLAVGRSDEAIDVVATGLRADPWSELLYRLQAEASLGRGDRAGAARAMAACRGALAELGVEPDAATIALENRLSDRGEFAKGAKRPTGPSR